MVNITIDGKKISAEENITIMEAAEKKRMAGTIMESGK